MAEKSISLVQSESQSTKVFSNDYTINGDVAFVEVKRTKTGEFYTFQCDVSDLDKLNQCLSWKIKWPGFVIFGYKKIDGRWIELKLHKLLSGSKFVDFLNGDRLDLRQANMSPLNKRKIDFANRGQVKGNRIDIHGDTATVWVIKKNGVGQAFLIDAQDVELVNKYTWFMINPGYPATWTLRGVKNRKLLLLHRYLTSAQPGQEVDHINRIKTDARRKNLRICTPSQNLHNIIIRKNSSTNMVGVAKTSKNGWRASIRIKNKRQYRNFATIHEAVSQRKEWERELNPSGLN